MSCFQLNLHGSIRKYFPITSHLNILEYVEPLKLTWPLKTTVELCCVKEIIYILKLSFTFREQYPDGNALGFFLAQSVDSFFVQWKVAFAHVRHASFILGLVASRVFLSASPFFFRCGGFLIWAFPSSSDPLFFLKSFDSLKYVHKIFT